MHIPFAELIGSRFARRHAALDLVDKIDAETQDIDDSLDTVDLPSAEPAQLLQKMESRLIRQHLANPGVLSDEELRKLRYTLNFARLADFEPGAAGSGGSRGRGDISVGAEVAPWRSRVSDTLYGRCAKSQIRSPRSRPHAPRSTVCPPTKTTNGEC